MARGMEYVRRWGAVALLFACAACTTNSRVVRTKPHRDVSNYIDAGGIKTYYEQKGTGPPTLVLIHGLAASTYVYHKVFDPLAEHFTVYAFDSKGFGATAKTRGDYTLNNLRDHLRDFLDAAGIERAVLVAHSMGGEVALRFALDAPERVQGLVLLDSAGYVQPEDSRETFRAILRWTLSGSHEKTRADVRAHVRPLRTVHGNRAWLHRRYGDDWGNVADRIPEITVPVLLMWCEDDPVLPVAHAERFKAALPQAKLITYPECGHRPQFEKPDAVAEAITAFVTGL